MKSLVLILVCGLIAGAIATMTAPRLLSWYATPPVPIGVSCDLAIDWSMEKLILFQAMGLAAGAALGAILGFKFRRKPAAAAAVAAPPNPNLD